MALLDTQRPATVPRHAPPQPDRVHLCCSMGPSPNCNTSRCLPAPGVTVAVLGAHGSCYTRNRWRLTTTEHPNLARPFATPAG